MPTLKPKSSGINLINKEVVFEQKVKGETQWYSGFNFLIIISITAFAGLAYAFTLFNNSSLETKKLEVVSYANKNVFVGDRSRIQSNLNTLNDKYALYTEVKDKSVDANTFYNDLSKVYPTLKIERFDIKTGELINAEVILTKNAYEELPAFLEVLYTKYENVKVNKISFQSESSTTSTNSNTTIASLSLTFKRNTDN